jgi:DNA-binding FadR family transcriptional regulator
LLQFDGSTLEELFEAWSALVPVCGRLAARHITREQITLLHEHIREMEEHLSDAVAFTALEVRFHTLVAHGTNNAVLRIYSASLAELTYHQIRNVQFTPEEMELGLGACQAILQSIEQGDGPRAEHRIAKHLAAVEEGITRQAQASPEGIPAQFDMRSRLAGTLAK